MTVERHPAAWQLLGGVFGRFGFDRPLRASEIFVPSRIELNGDKLDWGFDPSYGQDGWHCKIVRPGWGLLQGFIELADATDEKILAYAQRWGVLEICQHGRHASHIDYGTLPCAPQESYGLFWESLATWRSYAALFLALINIAARVNSGQRGNRHDWETVINARGLSGNEFFLMEGLSVDREKLEGVLSALVSEGQVHPVARWSKGRWSVQFAGGCRIGCSLFGALVCQLMLAVTQTEGLAVCSSCGRGYSPERRPNRERRNYCSLCRANKVPQRDAARAYRDKKRDMKH